MKPNYFAALVVGAVTGLVLALTLVLYVGATGGVPSVNAIIDGTRVIPVFAPPASALWIMVILTSAFAGFVSAVSTKAVASVIDPEAQSASLAVIAPLGILIAPVIGMAIFPLGVIVLGSIDEGAATLGVVDLVVLAGFTGFTVGGLVVWFSYILARPPAAKTDTSLHPDTADRSA